MPSTLVPPETEQLKKSAERVEAAPAKGGMNITEAISFSLEALKANRLRTFLTALGLIIGNASVILVVTISLASKDLILDQIRGIGSNLVFAALQASGLNAAQIQADFVKVSDVQALRDNLGNAITAATAVMPSS